MLKFFRGMLDGKSEDGENVIDRTDRSSEEDVKKGDEKGAKTKEAPSGKKINFIQPQLNYSNLEDDGKAASSNYDAESDCSDSESDFSDEDSDSDPDNSSSDSDDLKDSKENYQISAESLNNDARETERKARNTEKSEEAYDIKIEVLQQKSIEDSVLAPLKPDEDRTVIIRIDEEENYKGSVHSKANVNEDTKLDSKKLGSTSLENSDYQSHLNKKEHAGQDDVNRSPKYRGKEPTVRMDSEHGPGSPNLVVGGTKKVHLKKQGTSSLRVKRKIGNLKFEKSPTTIVRTSAEHERRRTLLNSSESRGSKRGRRKKQKINHSTNTFEVESILSKSESGFYLVKWKGWPVKDSSWETRENLSSCRKLLEKFEKRRRKPKVPKDAPPAPVLSIIEGILTKNEKKKLYLVKWKGWSTEESTWHSKSDLRKVGMAELVNEFEKNLKSDKSKYPLPLGAPEPIKTEILGIPVKS